MRARAKKVISFSLWGDLPLYNVGAVQNAELAKEIYPGWWCRYYVADDVPPATLSQLSQFHNVEIIEMRQPGSHHAACWRFYAIDDADVEVVVFRDLDSRLTQREKAAVDEWLASDRSFHIMRDSPLQHAAINAGTWGARARIPGGLRSRLTLYLEQNKLRDFGYSFDQHFLGDVIYPIIAPDFLVHDEFHERRPFPVRSIDGEFVGEKIMPDGSPDMEARALTRDCRTRPSKNIAVYYLRYGNRLKKVPERYKEALAYFRKAISLDQSLMPAYNNLGNQLQRLGRLSEAENVYRSAIAQDPNFTEAHANLGAIHLKRGELKKSLRSIAVALKLKPDYIPALQNLVFLREMQEDWAEAVAQLRHLVRLRPDDIQSLQRMATLAIRSEQWETVYDAYSRLLAVEPDSLPCFSHWLNARLRLCNWVDYEKFVDEIVQRNLASIEREGGPTTSLMDLNALPVPLDLHSKVARHLSSSIKHGVANGPGINRAARTRGARGIRVGYISPDLRNHAVGRLIHPLFGHHSRPRFTVHAYSLVSTGDPIQKAIELGCDVFRDMSESKPSMVAQHIADDGIDILIDLAGYTTHARPDILAYRPAPVQCMFMGFPDTMGGGLVDYLLADQWLIPDSLQPCYSEQIHYLPHAFVGAAELIPDCTCTRSDFELPEDGIVFLCNANNAHHKISPPLFDTWMELLSRVPGGVLWISGGCGQMQQNLRDRAAGSGVDPERVVFAPHLGREEYLQRLQLADLALDTLLYNGGSSSIATISAGVPLLTCAGSTNASRMGASICAAAGLESMIMHSLSDYLERAIELATERQELRRIRASLVDRGTLPLFDVDRFVKTLESAIHTMVGQASSLPSD